VSFVNTIGGCCLFWLRNPEFIHKPISLMSRFFRMW